ncbi:DUF6783 domain-containing protein [Ruminococcus sp. 1001136sp1]|uniref:DUF6783 domain-containing protein n=1 Tax=Clostridia TaxID=186801 RepID=UPI002FE60E63
MKISDSFFSHPSFLLSACLKKAFCKMYITICGDFSRIRVKYTAKWGVQTAEFFSNTLQIRKAVISFCPITVFL